MSDTRVIPRLVREYLNAEGKSLFHAWLKSLKNPTTAAGVPTMPKRTRSYEKSLQEDLRDPAEAAVYLNVALEGLDEPDGMELFLVALGHVIRALGVSEVARGTGLGRESLYKFLGRCPAVAQGLAVPWHLQTLPMLTGLLSALNACSMHQGGIRCSGSPFRER